MTTGTFTFEPPLSPTDCGPARVGLYYQKSWSGQDYPPQRPTYGYTYVPEKIIPGYWAYSPLGRKVWIREKRIKGFARRYKVKPPKRARSEEHPYSCNWTKRNDPSFLWSDSSGPRGTGTIGSCFGGLLGPSNPWDSNDEIALLGKLREAVAGSDFNLGVFLAESNQALGMIFNTARKIDGAWSAARKGNFARATEILTGKQPGSLTKRKRLANNWLELQYGWLPLLKDAEAGAQFLAHHLDVPMQKVVRVRRTKRESWSPTSAAPSLCVMTRGYNLTRVQIKAILKEKDVLALSGLTDPLSVAWEKLPYSFVVDWFIPIGNYLAARGLANAIEGTFVISRKWQYFASDPKGLSGYDFSSPKYYETGGTFARTVEYNLSVPLPGIKPLDRIVSWRRAANAVSLLLQKQR